MKILALAMLLFASTAFGQTTTTCEANPTTTTTTTSTSTSSTTTTTVPSVGNRYDCVCLNGQASVSVCGDPCTEPNVKAFCAAICDPLGGVEPGVLGARCLVDPICEGKAPPVVTPQSGGGTCDCDLNEDGEFTVEDVLVLLLELVGITDTICEAPPVGPILLDLVWRGPPIAAVDFIVAYDASGLFGDCTPGDGLLASVNDDQGSGEARFAAVNSSNVADGTVLFSCVLDDDQNVEGMLATVTNAANFSLESIEGDVELVATGFRRE